nr:D-alanyl-D-alanine carboxypeptidase family protein [Nitrosomonas nitrosa]
MTSVVELIKAYKSRPIPTEEALRSSSSASISIDEVELVASEIDQEPLIPVGSVGLLSRDYYFHFVEERLNPTSAEYKRIRPLVTEDVYLRRSVALDLRAIDEQLTHCGLRLFLLSGYRSHLLQRAIRAVSERQRGKEKTEYMLADPDRHAPHSTGAAFDVELRSSSGGLVETKVPGDPEAFETARLERMTPIPEALVKVRDNRRVLFHALTAGELHPTGTKFISNPKEYWHFGRNEKLSAAIALSQGQKHQAFYPEIPDAFS